MTPADARRHADRLDDVAKDIAHHDDLLQKDDPCRWGGVGTHEWHKAVTDAAAIARRHANLLDAIGDPDELRAIGDRLRQLDPYWSEAESRKRTLDRIAAAVDAAREDR